MKWYRQFTSSSSYDSEVTTRLLKAKSDKGDEYDFPSNSVEEQTSKDKILREHFYKVLINGTEMVYMLLLV